MYTLDQTFPSKTNRLLETQKGNGSRESECMYPSSTAVLILHDAHDSRLIGAPHDSTDRRAVRLLCSGYAGGSKGGTDILMLLPSSELELRGRVPPGCWRPLLETSLDAVEE